MNSIKNDPFCDVPKIKKIRALGISISKSKTLSESEINLQYFKKSRLYDFLKGLNQVQMEIVLHKCGSIICSAVPGAGKTRTLVYKVAYLIEHCGVDPSRILVVTFTKKSADEIRERIEKILSKERDERVITGTFHSICHRFLKALGKIKGITHVDDDKKSYILQEIITGLSKNTDTKYVKAVLKNSLNDISNAKNNMVNIADYKLKDPDSLRTKIYEKYQEYLNDHNHIDFDDLLMKMAEEMRTNEESRNYLENRFDYVFVDEFQDTSTLQFEIVACFAKKTKNITIVGDTDQSIYGWRFADSTNINKFIEMFPDHTKYYLSHNYRSTKNIVNCCNSVIEQEKNRINNKIVTDNNAGDKVILHEFVDPDTEARNIATKIAYLNKHNKIDFCNIAILLRVNSQSRALEEALSKNKIPFKLVGTQDFYNSDEIQFLISYLKFLINKKDILSFRTIINIYGDERDIACKKLEQDGYAKFSQSYDDERAIQLFELIKKCDDLIANSEEPTTILQTIIDDIDYEYELDDDNKWANVGELVNVSKRYQTLETFLMDIVIAENGKMSMSSEVSILTVHTAKGLEWDVVFIPSIVESLLPHSKAIDPQNIDSKNQVAEERRLLYVAMTRAKQKLFLSYCRTIFEFGRKKVVQMSRFLNFLPQESFTLLKN